MVGEPRMGGRGFRCRKSGSLGEPRRGRQDCSPWGGCGGLAGGWPNTAPRGSVGGLGSLGRTMCRSERLGALCRRLPSPAVRGECSGTEEPGWDGVTGSLRSAGPAPHAAFTLWATGEAALPCAPEATGTERWRHPPEVTQRGQEVWGGWGPTAVSLPICLLLARREDVRAERETATLGVGLGPSPAQTRDHTQGGAAPTWTRGPAAPHLGSLGGGHPAPAQALRDGSNLDKRGCHGQCLVEVTGPPRAPAHPCRGAQSHPGSEAALTGGRGLTLGRRRVGPAATQGKLPGQGGSVLSMGRG